MLIINQLFQDMEAAVLQQEAPVQQIEDQGNNVTENVAKGNTELDGAVKKARAARRKKWWCFGIIGTYYSKTQRPPEAANDDPVLILIIIAVVVAVAVTVTKNH